MSTEATPASGSNAGAPVVPTEGVAADASATAKTSTSSSAAPSKDDVYEVTVGKDNKGQPILKKFSREEILKAAGEVETAKSIREEGRKNRADMETLAKALKDPNQVWKVLKALGHDEEALIMKKAQEAIEDSKLSPEQKEARLNKAELEALRKESTARKAREDELATNNQAQVFTKKLTETTDAALTAAKLPNTPKNRAAVANALKTLWPMKDETGKQIWTDPFQIPLDKVIGHIKGERVGGLKDLLEGADEETLIALLGEDFVDRIAKAKSKQLQKAQKTTVDNTVTNEKNDEPAKPKKAKRPETMEEFQARKTEETRVAQLAWERRRNRA